MSRPRLLIFLTAAAFGVAVAVMKRSPAHEAARATAAPPCPMPDRVADRDGGVTPPALPPAAFIQPWLRARQLIIPGADASPLLQLAIGDEGPGLWMWDAARRGALQAGVHGNGFPFVLVSDSAIENFALGRVDGRNASPILVIRSNDIVKLVFGLSMTEAGQEPFLVHWGADDKKRVLFGDYCDDPSRACTN